MKETAFPTPCGPGRDACPPTGVYLFRTKTTACCTSAAAHIPQAKGKNYFARGGTFAYRGVLVARAKGVDFVVTGTGRKPILENNLIKHRPLQRVVLKDDRATSPPRYQHAFPRLTVVRPPRWCDVLQPVASAGSVRQTLRTLGRIFPMRIPGAKLRQPDTALSLLLHPALSGPCVDASRRR